MKPGYPQQIHGRYIGMLFIFLLDNGESMNKVKFNINHNNMDDDLNKKEKEVDNFLPTSMDASIYFIQQYCKVSQKLKCDFYCFHFII